MCIWLCEIEFIDEKEILEFGLQQQQEDIMFLTYQRNLFWEKTWFSFTRVSLMTYTFYLFHSHPLTKPKCLLPNLNTAGSTGFVHPCWLPYLAFCSYVNGHVLCTGNPDPPVYGSVATWASVALVSCFTPQDIF